MINYNYHSMLSVSTAAINKNYLSYKSFTPGLIKQPVNTMSAYLIVSFLLFIIGIFGLINNHKNIISALISLELMFLAAMINFTASSVFMGNPEGQILAIFLLAISAIKISIGLSIVILFFRKNNSIRLDKIN